MRFSPLGRAVVLVLLSAFSAAGQTMPLYDRASSAAGEGRSMVVARRGMVATSQPLATQAGLDVLRRGGNAVDAALAANAVQGVVEPMSCGIGGDLFVIYWDAKTKKLYGLNASGRSPYELTIDKVRAAGHASLPDKGPLSWSVPGCVRGWEDLRARFGSWPLAEILAPAIEYADEGFPVSPVIGADWQGSASMLAATPESSATYLVDNKTADGAATGRRRAPRVGEMFRNQRLAATYRRLATTGADDFYKGSLAREIVAYSQRTKGYFTERDFAEHHSDWIEPVATNYRGYDVWELPPNGQGIAALQMLNLLEPYDLRSFGPGSAEYLHLFVEAKKLAYADRARYYADPTMADVPTARLISKPYANERRKLMSAERAMVAMPPGDEKLVHGDTIYLTVVDKDRNCCSLIQSNYYGFGSQYTAGELGFALQNRGALFSLDPKHPNALAPHKRPFHTIIPAMVTKENEPVFCFGVMGGDMQPQGHVQVLVNLIDFQMNPQAAGDAARVRHGGSATPTGQPAEADGGTVYVESGISEATVAKLRKLGHEVVRSRGGYGGYQGIWIDRRYDTLLGASESRKDGCAAGW
ncbi:MAG: gamma-glutamyltransferase [Planctomycetia bacterium]|nr:gamma-glutamyltransferase [Planctomycetia bacterium]